ncbi:MAG: hypothetical protein RBT71_07025 [Flavobacteriales bacterium]|jgi:hypothetical protein|nr:hypothetical protein [Flavobacteriales bacterium]
MAKQQKGKAIVPRKPATRNTARKAAARKSAGKPTPAQAAKKAAQAEKQAEKTVNKATARKSAAKKTAAAKKTSVGRNSARRSTAKKTPTAGKMAPERGVPGAAWPDAIEAGRDVHAPAIDHRGAEPRAQVHAVQGSPNELHPGVTRRAGKSHDRPGSQPERKRHQYPASEQPNRGSAHTTEAKGRRRPTEPPEE